MSSWSPVYVPEIETGRHVKNNACTVEIKIKWMIRKHMTYENTYRDDSVFWTCTETCQKYLVTVIFYYIFHIKPQFFKALFKSQFLFDFDESLTNRSENVRSFL